MEHDIFIYRDKTGLGSNQAAALIRRAVNAALDCEGIDVPCEVNVLLTDDEGIHGINLEFRGVDRATDVLSFPMNELVPGGFDAELCEINPESGKILLGDMAMSLERARAQGEEFGHGANREISYLTIHSVLHLLGYDHMDEGEEKRLMRGHEKAVCARLGI
ncbi:MAG: rRNA maturation RNase YbeY [Candidatus Heteroscillospira sp.]|jgi:probable rRNA maturation factor